MQHHLGGDWEFKILRSTTAAFRRRHTMEQALREEAEAGWTLLEKLDDSRLRLVRRRDAEGRDTRGTIDPYRSFYGMGQGATALLAVAIMIVVMFGVLALVLLLT